MIESVISLVQLSSSPSSGDDLKGFVMDVDEAFYSASLFQESDVITSFDHSCLVKVHASIAPTIMSVQQISDALQQIAYRIGYQYLTATAITWYQEATVLRFVTVTTSNGFYVTGMAVTTGSKYKKLVDRFDREFGNLHGPLKPYPGGLPDWARQSI